MQNLKNLCACSNKAADKQTVSSYTKDQINYNQKIISLLPLPMGIHCPNSWLRFERLFMHLMSQGLTHLLLHIISL